MDFQDASTAPNQARKPAATRCADDAQEVVRVPRKGAWAKSERAGLLMAPHPKLKGQLLLPGSSDSGRGGGAQGGSGLLHHSGSNQLAGLERSPGPDPAARLFLHAQVLPATAKAL